MRPAHWYARSLYLASQPEYAASSNNLSPSFRTAGVGDNEDDIASAQHGARANNGAVPRFCFYFGELMNALIKRGQLREWVSTVADLIEKIKDSKVWELETKVKELRIDAIKLHVRDMNLASELVGVLASEMVNDWMVMSSEKVHIKI
jgi:hypothetical protein